MRSWRFSKTFFRQSTAKLDAMNMFTPSLNNMMVNAFNDISFVVNDKILFGSILLLQRNIFMWDVSTAENITRDSLTMVEFLNPSPEIMIIGTGANQVFLDEKLTKHFEDLGIDVLVMDTRNALSTFNILLQEDRNVICGLITLRPLNTKELSMETFTKKSIDDVPDNVHKPSFERGRKSIPKDE